jgi:hypothetical protein
VADTFKAVFFYHNDNQEADIEFLSDPQSLSNPKRIPQVWFTNQDADYDGRTSEGHVTPPADATSVEHEYRIDWTKDSVSYFIDGDMKWSSSANVASEPAAWVWNNWANGDKYWSWGPPAKDAIFKVSDIKMYFNRADD